MAKATGNDKKVTFGSRKRGRAYKTRGPKDKKVSKYRGQG